MQRGTMNYLLPILIIAVLASQATIWHSLATIRDAIQQTNAIILAACGSDERPCQVAAHRGQIELGEIMVRTRIRDGFSWLPTRRSNRLRTLLRCMSLLLAQSELSETIC